jgi:hypothetical protein
MSEDRPARDNPPWLSGRRLAWVLALALLGVCVFLLLTCGSAKSAGTKGDFPVFYEAGRRLPLGENIYEKPADAGEYIYPPLLAAIFTPLSKLGRAGCAWAWAAINISMLMTVLMLGARDVVRRMKVGPDHVLTLGVALLGVVLSIDKVKSVVSGGQTDLITVLGVALGLIYHERKPAVSGAALALAANIKYTPLAFVPYLILRRRYAAAAWTLAFFVLFALVPALVVGWDSNLRLWGIALGGVARLFGYSGATVFAGSIRDATHHLSISITSAITRAMAPEPGKDVAMLASGCVALGVALASWWMYARRGVPLFWRAPARAVCDSSAGPVNTGLLAAIEWCGIIIAILAFSPQTQGRHLILLLVVHLVAAGMLLRPPSGVPRAWLVLGLVAIQLGMNLPPSTPSTQGAVDKWRAIGGAGWCLLPMWFGVLWTGLACVRGEAVHLGAARRETQRTLGTD